MSLALFFAIYSFSVPETLLKMVDAVYIPDTVISIQGTDEQNEPLIFEYDKKTGEMLKYSQKKENGEKKKEFDLFLKLFFFSSDHTSPETMTKASAAISEKLKKNGIDPTLTTVSVEPISGDPVISIGKEKRFSNGNELAVYKDSFLPSHLTLNDVTVVFSEYHKSVLPASFPGKMEFYRNGSLEKTWIFYRKELRQ